MAPMPRITPHSAFETLPLVDISGLFSSLESELINAATALGDAAAQAGFLYVTGHGTRTTSSCGSIRSL
jgi:isopenicillin N synthase-like dioxygenase